MGSHLTPLFLSHSIYTSLSDPIGSLKKTHKTYLEFHNFSLLPFAIIRFKIPLSLTWIIFKPSPLPVYPQSGFQSDNCRMLIQIMLSLLLKSLQWFQSHSEKMAQEACHDPGSFLLMISCYYFPSMAPLQARGHPCSLSNARPAKTLHFA